jgi:hypothetical protein
MRTTDELIQEAAAARRLAQVVSFRPDKERLMAQAAELQRLAEDASRRPDRQTRLRA